MQDQTFEEYAAVWIYLLSSTDNTLKYIPCGSDFAYEFKWEPRNRCQARRQGEQTRRLDASH